MAVDPSYCPTHDARENPPLKFRFCLPQTVHVAPAKLLGEEDLTEGQKQLILFLIFQTTDDVNTIFTTQASHLKTQPLSYTENKNNLWFLTKTTEHLLVCAGFHAVMFLIAMRGRPGGRTNVVLLWDAKHNTLPGPWPH